jgi:predicted permease
MNRHVSRLVAMLRRWFRGATTSDRALDDEIASVLQHAIDARVASGMSPEEARQAARAAFGSIEPIKEQVRDARTGALIEHLLRDVRYASRGMRRSPGLSVAVVASLAVGLAVTVAAVAFVNAMLFGSYPGVVDQHQLIQLTFRWGPRPIGYSKQSEADYLVLREGLDGLQGLAAYDSAGVTVGLPEPRSLTAGLVSGNYFDVFGARPVLGRMFGPEEERPEHASVAVISHDVWRRDFGSDPDVIGRAVRIADTAVTIVGVAPAGFGGTSPGVFDLWVPLALTDSVVPESTSMPGRPRGLAFVGRLKDAVGPEQVQAAAATIVAQLLASEGRPGQDTWTDLRGVSRIDPAYRAWLVLAVMPIPTLVLVIACVNASALLLARGARRRHELAIRLAIGAGRARIVRQLVIESLLYGLIAAGVGTLLASWGLQIAGREFSLAMPIDLSVLAWTLTVTVAAAVASGIAPALRVSGYAPFRALKSAHVDGEGLRPAPKGRRLVTAQIALSIGVLATATQLVSAVVSEGGSAGTQPDRLLIAAFDLDQLRLSPDVANRFYGELVDRASTLPGVEAAGLARRTAVWTFGQGKSRGSLVVWQPGATAREGDVILGGYAGGDLLGALGLAVVEGRGFGPRDRSGSPRVAVVNETFARQMDGPTLGRMLRVLGHARGPQTSEEAFAAGRDVQIVGVIQSAGEPRYSIDGEAVPKIYLPAPLQPEPELALYVRTRNDANGLAAPVRELVHAIDPRVPILDIGSLSQWNERSMGPVVWLTRAASFIGLVALLLTASGLLAVMSYVVSQRSREFAIRMALGSRPGGVLRLVLRQSMRMVVVGFAIGGGLALLATRLLQTQFRGADGLDVPAFVGSGALLVVVMLLAGGVPAIRASRVDPVAGLKEG